MSVLSGTKALAFGTARGRASTSAIRHLHGRNLRPRKAGYAANIVANRESGAEHGHREVWVSGALGDVKGGPRRILVLRERDETFFLNYLLCKPASLQ